MMNRLWRSALAIGLACSASAIASAALQNSEQPESEAAPPAASQEGAPAGEGNQPEAAPSADTVSQAETAPPSDEVTQTNQAPASEPAPQSDPPPAARNETSAAPEQQVDAQPDARAAADGKPATCPAPFERADLVFADDRASEQRLRALLARKPDRVVLNSAAAFAPERPPARLQRWLAEVKGSGGEVSRTEISCAATRSLFKKLLTVAVDVASERLKSELSKPAVNRFAAAHGYDVIFWTRSETGQVQQIEFQRRGEEEAG